MSDIMKWEPFKDINKVFEKMDKMFAPLFESFAGEMQKSPLFANILDLQIREEDGDIVVKGYVPDEVKDNLDVVVHQNKVIVSGEGALTKDHAGAKEYQWGKFTRIYHLPVKVQSEKAQVNFEKGQLKIRAPRER
jgi:HSP20 family molecular chaperone IbpA